MRVLEIDYTMKLHFSVPVSNHCFLLRCLPSNREKQKVLSSSFSVLPECSLIEDKDVFENKVFRGFLPEKHETFSFHVCSIIKSESYLEGFLGECHPFYFYPSRMTECSPEMKDFALSFLGEKCIKGNECEIAFDLGKEIFRHMKYESGSTTIKTSSSFAFKSGKGVCQDFAHIFCALSRFLGIASRYVSGTSLGEGTTHAWVEFFVPDDEGRKKGEKFKGKWVGLDPTRNRIVDDSYVVLGYGRDFWDCPVDRGIFFGNADQIQTVFVKTKEIKREET